NANLSRVSLHGGWAGGGLQPDEQCSRPVRDRRSELLGSRGEPTGRQRIAARAGVRVRYSSLHPRGLLLLRPCRETNRRATRIAASDRGHRRPHNHASRNELTSYSTRISSCTWEDGVG